MRDTSPAAAQVQIEAIRRLTPATRLTQALALSESTRAFALSRLRAMHPTWSELELVELLLGVPLIPVRSADPEP